MNSMKLKAAALALCLGLLAGCGMDESLTMTPETGEKIEVTLDRGMIFPWRKPPARCWCIRRKR